MKINLIRNLNTKRDKEQEDSFEVTMNLALYFDINKKIEKIDGWRMANVKKLVNSIDSVNDELDIEFSKWDDNVEYIFNNAKVNLIQYNEIDVKITNSLRNCDLITIHNYLKEIADDKNLKMEFLFAIADQLRNNIDAILIINEFVNNGISTLDVAIDSILPLLLLEDYK